MRVDELALSQATRTSLASAGIHDRCPVILPDLGVA